MRPGQSNMTSAAVLVAFAFILWTYNATYLPVSIVIGVIAAAQLAVGWRQASRTTRT